LTKPPKVPEVLSETRHSATETEPFAPGLGVYVHWPFCLSKCPYCDFNSHVRESIDQARWQEAFLSELDHFATETAGRRVASVFFGGGTPSLMAPRVVAALLERIDSHWRLDPAVEITLEANPTSAEAARFTDYRAAGVNRLSLGVQALDDRALAFLGRRHSAAEALGAVALARRHFPRFSFDLTYARPGQAVAAWRRELGRALEEGAEHLSLYQLTIEEGTSFHAAWRRGDLVLPEAAQAADHYEISNHARAGAESRHNLTYWRYGDYLGIGPGAHGRLTLGETKVATRQHRAPEAWLATVESDGHATRVRAELGRAERLVELTMMGLRLIEGIARTTFRRELAADPEEVFAEERLSVLRRAGYLELDAAGLRATAAGLQRLDAVLAHLLSREPPSTS
jgi:oxygen-independent coproporphyrinogen-3 oxidase